MNVTLHRMVLAGAAASLLACSSSAPSSPFPASSTLAARCAAPRTGIDPTTGAPYSDRQGTVADEKAWVRSWIDELYLWYREVPDVDASTYAAPEPYFEVLKTNAVTTSGRPKDQFHFTYPTNEWTSLIEAGVDVGYGLQWALLLPTVPREVVVAYVQPGTPVPEKGIGRGFRLLTADGADVVSGTGAEVVAAINAALFPATVGEVHTFVFQDTAGATVTATLTADSYATAPVQNVGTLDPGDGLGPIGYFAFHDHVAVAESALFDAVASLQAKGITDLVVDLRYNGGGYLDVASELAFMIAGPAATTGKTFEQTVFNDKYPGKDPVSGHAVAPLGFESKTQGFSLAPGQPLPALGLGRVFLLTGRGTCSASESIINGLQGIGVQVVQIGSPTCGKPYGFYPQDNCGTTYFAIEFQGVNAKGFGDYADGFTPGGTGDVSPPGCVVADDFDHELGDPAEDRLAAALAYRATGRCPAPATVTTKRSLLLRRGTVDDPVVPKSPLLTNRIVRR